MTNRGFWYRTGKGEKSHWFSEYSADRPACGRKHRRWDKPTRWPSNPDFVDRCKKCLGEWDKSKGFRR